MPKIEEVLQWFWEMIRNDIRDDIWNEVRLATKNVRNSVSEEVSEVEEHKREE